MLTNNHICMKANNKSFTLIELLVVIVIIGILAGVIMISTSSSIDKANFAKAQAFSSTVQNELLLNLVSEWTFDEPEENGKTKDTWGGNNGTISGATYKAKDSGECVSGGCYGFDGSNDYIRAPHNGVYNFNEQSSFTMSVWSKITGHPPVYYVDGDATHRATGLFLKGHHSGSFGIQSDHDQVSNGVYTRLRISSGIRNRQLFSSIALDTFYHIVLVYEMTDSKQIIEFWLNGTRVGYSSSSTILSFGNTAHMSIGDNNIVGGNRYYPKGLLDEARIYNTALSSAQIKQNYIAGLDSLLSNGNISKEEYNERINALAYDKE